MEEILTPFYIFQILACALWMVDQYYYYAFCIIVISLISMILSLVETKRVRFSPLARAENCSSLICASWTFQQAVTLHDMVKSRLVVSVCRAKDVFEAVPAEHLVPGDVIEIPGGHESTMACDAILLNGNCIVNESMLTGNWRTSYSRNLDLVTVQKRAINVSEPYWNHNRIVFRMTDT